MAELIYGLCALTAFLCAYLLLHAYRRSHYRLLLWGAICFAGLTLNNVLVMFDKFVVPDQDLTLLRLLAALISISILLYGLIFDAE